MIAICPQCAISLTFDDERLPTEPFNVLCPRCRQTVTVMPPPREDPRLPGSTGTLDIKSVVESDEPDPLRQLIALLTTGIKRSQSPRQAVKKWQRSAGLL